MAIIGKFRSHIHRDAATLSIEAAHDQVERTGINIRADREMPASTDPGNLQVVLSRGRNGREVSCLYRVARVLVGHGRGKLAFEYRRIIAGTLERERRAGCANEG